MILSKKQKQKPHWQPNTKGPQCGTETITHMSKWLPIVLRKTRRVAGSGHDHAALMSVTSRQQDAWWIRDIVGTEENQESAHAHTHVILHGTCPIEFSHPLSLLNTWQWWLLLEGRTELLRIMGKWMVIHLIFSPKTFTQWACNTSYKKLTRSTAKLHTARHRLAENNPPLTTQKSVKLKQTISNSIRKK